MNSNITPEVDLLCQRFIDKFKEEREKRDISTYKLSDMTGIRQSNLTRMETYQAYPSLATFMKILNALELDFQIIPKNSPKSKKS